MKVPLEESPYIKSYLGGDNNYLLIVPPMSSYKAIKLNVITKAIK